jgi:hypothetical protein
VLQAETTLINFTVTEAGLEDQLLALVVDKERPDLEETKTQLIIQNSEFTIKLKQVGLSLHCVTYDCVLRPCVRGWMALRQVALFALTHTAEIHAWKLGAHRRHNKLVLTHTAEINAWKFGCNTVDITKKK